jgi:hypothetical protein
MRIGPWLSFACAGAVMFVIGCAAPPGGYAKKRSSGGMMYKQGSGAKYGAEKRAVRRMKKGALLAEPAEEPAAEEPAAPAAPAAVPAAAPAEPEREPLTEEEKKELESQL